MLFGPTMFFISIAAVIVLAIKLDSSLHMLLPSAMLAATIWVTLWVTFWLFVRFFRFLCKFGSVSKAWYEFKNNVS